MHNTQKHTTPNTLQRRSLVMNFKFSPHLPNEKSACHTNTHAAAHNDRQTILMIANNFINGEAHTLPITTTAAESFSAELAIQLGRSRNKNEKETENINNVNCSPNCI